MGVCWCVELSYTVMFNVRSAKNKLSSPRVQNKTGKIKAGEHI